MIRRIALAAVLATAALGLAASPALAGKPHGNAVAASCAVGADNVVRATGLPTDEVINFMVTDSSGTHGWVLGFTFEGTWAVSVPASSGPTTYEFASRTWGPSGSKYTVFASC